MRMNYEDFVNRVKNPEYVKENNRRLFTATFLNDVSKSEKIELAKLPEPTRNMIDDLAANVMDLDNFNTIVLGYPLSGKSFLIEQLAYNIDEYRKKNGSNEIHFIYVTDVDMIELSTTENLKKLQNELMKSLNCNPSDLCFVTESVEASIYLSTVLSSSRTILEVNIDSFAEVIMSTSPSVAKIWSSHQVVDANQVYCTMGELLDLLDNTILKRLNEKFPNSLHKDQVADFIKYCMKQMPDLVQNLKGRKVIVVPPGVWATVVRKLMANLTYSQGKSVKNKNGEIVFSKVMKKTLEDCEELFGNLMSSGIGNKDLSVLKELSLPEEIMNILSMEEREGRIGGKIHKKEVTPLEFKDVSTLSDRLKNNIFGQDEAVEKVGESFIVPAAGLNDHNKPVRSFLFLGPTGVGKTQLALELAKELSNKELNVVRIDMSEYQQEHSSAKLYGSPPGYVGYEDGGHLTSAVAEHPHSIVLLDEIEKAHEKIWDSFLQVLDSGRMTDGRGNVIDFTQTIVIMTSNIGAVEAARSKAGFAGLGNVNSNNESKEMRSIIVNKLEETMKPELINRIDDVVYFNAIDSSTAKTIIDKEINVIRDRLSSRSVKLADPDIEVVDFILDKADIKKYGAREIKRIVYKNISENIARFVIENKNVKEINISKNVDKITVSKK